MGLRIDVDTSRGISSLSDFRKSLKDTGAESRLTASEIQALEERFDRKLSADKAEAALAKARQRIEEIGKAAGLSQREIQGLTDRLGVTADRTSEATTATAALGNTFNSLALKVGAVATAYVSLRNVMSFVSDATTLAARYDTLGTVMVTVGRNSGYAAGELDSLEQALQKTGISMNASRQSIAQMIQANMDLASATKLARSAQDAAVVGGINSSEAFDRMTTAIQTAQPEMLRTMGIVVNFDQAYRKAAQALGTSSEALTENQKMQARANSTMEATRTIAGAYSASMETAGKQALSLSRYWEDLKTSLGESFQPAYKALIEGATAAIKSFSVTIKDPSFQKSVEEMAGNIGKLAEAMAKVSKYAGLRSISSTFAEGAELAKQGRIDWQEFIRASFEERQRMVDSLKIPDDREAKTQSILNGSNFGTVMPDGELERLFNAKRLQEAYDLQNSISIFLDRNKSFQSTAALLDDATKTWTGERSIASRSQQIAKEIGDTQMLADAEKMQAEADQKLIETRTRLIQADEQVRRSVQSLAAAVSADMADLTGDKYTAAAIRAFQEYNSEMDQFNDQMATYKGQNKESLTSAGQQWIAEKYQIAQARIELERWQDSMNAASSTLSELGRLTGDPEAIYGGLMTAAQAWEADQAKRIGAIQDESERTKQLGELQQVMALKELEARRQAYSGMSAVSSKYWEAEKQTLEQHLSTVKANAIDETAYRIYAAEQWDDYNKKLLEKQASYSGTFADTFAAKWSLAFGSYKSELTKAQDDFKKFSDDIIELSNGIADVISGGFGDAFRNIANGEFSLQNWSKNTLSRIVDSASGFLEKSVKSTFTDLFASFGAGASSESATTAISSAMASVDVSTATITIASATISGAGGLSGTDTLAGGSGSDTLGQDIGRSAGDSFTSQLSGLSSSSSDASLLFTSASDASELIGGAVSDKMSSAIWATHNNPGNIRSGSGFASYDSMQDGLNAMADLLKSYERRGYDTVNKIVSRYAPSSENNTAAYIASVSKEMGVGPNDRLYLTSDSDMLMKLQKAMTRIEGSRGALTDDMFYNATHAKQVGQAMGDSAGDRLVENLTSSSSDLSMVIGDAPDIGKSFAKASAQYGDVYNPGYAGSGLYDASSSRWSTDSTFAQDMDAFRKATGDSSGINWKAAGTVLGGLSMLGAGVASGNAMSAIGGGLSSIGGLIGMFATAGSALATGGPILAAVGMGIGLLGGLTSSTTKTEKTGSGYQIAINAGTLQMSGVDFYRTTTTGGMGGTTTSHSMVNTGLTDPDVAKKIVDSLKSVAESLHDYAKELGFVADSLLENFSMPEMTVTGDQLDSYIRNLSNAMAYQALDNAGLRGAFDYVAEAYETYDNEFKRLGDAYKTVGGYTEAYGYDLQALAGITQDQIDAIRETNTQVAQGTTPALLTMASAMGATADQIALLTANASDGSQALDVTDKQLSKILQADYASKIVDAVGGSDAFEQVMGNLVKNTLNSIGTYQKQATYYTTKSNEAIADLGDPSVTIGNFWTSFDAAMKRGLTVDQFESWADASSWVNNFQVISDAITDFYNTIEKLGQSLQARTYKALGYDQASAAATQIASNRWELYDAGKAGYDGATLAAITATQGAEVAKSLRDIFDTAQSALDDAVGGSKVPSEISTLRTKFDDLAEAARILGASEQDLADIRAKEQATIEAKRQGLLSDAASTLAGVLGDDMGTWLTDTQSKFDGFALGLQALGATEEDLALVRSQEQATLEAKLGDVIASITDQVDDATLTDTEQWYKSLHKSVIQAIEDARALGASEQDLADIRADEQTIIAAKLGDFMADIHEALSTFDGTELAYSVSSLQKEMAGKLYDAALLGASQADLTDVGTLYAYKVKAAYQEKIDAIVSQLKTAADALDTFSTSIKDFLDGLWTDSDVSPLTVTGQYAEAQSQWRKAAAELSSADEAVRSAAQDKIQGLTTTLLKDSQAANSTAAAYYADFAEVQATLGDSYKQAKTDHDLLQAQLDAATGTEDSTKTTAELMDQLHTLQQEQGATWTQMLTDLPKDIADAILEALGLKKTGASAGGGGGGSNDFSYGAYGSADAWDAAYVAAEQSYLEQKAASLNAAGTNGKTDWNVYDVAKSISDLGLTPYEHFFEYGSGETNTSTGAYLSWGQGPTTPAPRNLSTGGGSWDKYDVIGYNLDIGGAFNESAYLSNKVDQLNATATGGRTNWTEADVTASLAGLGLTPAEHFAQYGQYEGVKPYATGGLVADLARSGGYLPGYSATDIQPAILRLGEYVMTPEAVQQYGRDYFDALNSRKVPAFASGGLVSPSPVSRPPYSGGAASSSSSGNNDPEVKALRQEVAELKGILRGMASDAKQSREHLDRIVYNTNPN